MGKLIGFVFFLVLCSFGFVLLQLSLRRPARGPSVPRASSTMLEIQEDGSVYAVGLRLSRLEDRLVEEEKYSGALREEITALRAERAELTRQLDVLRGEVRTLRTQVNRPAPPVRPPVQPPPGNNTPPAGNTPPSNVPAPPLNAPL